MTISAIFHTGTYILDQGEALDFYVGKLRLEFDAAVHLGLTCWLTVREIGRAHV